MNRSDRVLVAVTYGFSVRYLLPTGVLDRLREVCRPVVGIGWDDDELRDLLTERGFEVVRLPDPVLSHDYRMFRRRLALVHQRRLNSVTTVIRRRNPFEVEPDWRLRVIAELRNIVDRIVVRLPGGVAAVESAELGMVDSGTNISDFIGFVAHNNFAAVLSLAPYHDQEGLLLLAARQLGVRSVTSVISFDNPTTRSRWLARSDRVLVWNEFNAREVLRSYPDLSPDQVSVIGAPQFDLHRQPGLVADETEWRTNLGLEPGRKIILYGASPELVVPGESVLVELIDRAISDGSIPGRPLLLVRRHPNDRPDMWREAGRRFRNARVVDPWPAGTSRFRGWPSQNDIREQMSSLAHTDVHVNFGSSMSLDGAMFDKPQICPTFLPGAQPAIRRRVRTFYQQEHLQPIIESGGVTLVDNEQELIASLRNDLENPGHLSLERKRMIAAVLTWDDGRSSERLVGEVAQLDCGSIGRTPDD